MVTNNLISETIIEKMMVTELVTVDKTSLCIREKTDKGNLNISCGVLLVDLEDGNCVKYFLMVNIGSAGGYLYFECRDYYMGNDSETTGDLR